jgi:hypothetical protein
MPPRKHFNKVGALEQLRGQARALITALREAIRTRETELRLLKEEEATLSSLGGGGEAASLARNGRAPRVREGSSSRVDWSGVLQGLPKQFKAADVRTVNVVKSKRPSEIFAAITRWIEAGAVKRKARGVYERV